MRYLVRVTELETGRREFLIPYTKLPAEITYAIAKAKPISTLARPMRVEDPECFAMLDRETCRILSIAELADSQALALADEVSPCPNE
jgi:hypothetical protein